MKTCLLSGWLLMVALDGLHATAAAATETPSASAPLPGTGSVQVPLAITVELQDCTPAQEPVYSVAIDIQLPPGRPDPPGTLQVTLTANGTVRIVGRQNWILTGSDAARAQRLCARFAVSGLGDGAVVATVAELGTGGQPRWAPTDTLFVLQGPHGLLAGKSSSLELWRTLLSRDLAARRITRAEYERRLQRLLERGRLDVDKR